jgi:methionyl-tRNA formyltransferase
LRSVFFGTPAFAVPCLDALHAITDIRAVICQPDKPQGRGQELGAPPVKTRALELGLAVHQPTKVRTEEFASWLTSLNVDIALVVAYGRILTEQVLAVPRHGCINVHASILPKYRGAAPITWALVRGETETGVTLMQMDAGMDTGDMLKVHRTPIGIDETTGELSQRLSELGARAVREDFLAIAAQKFPRLRQVHADATSAPLLKKEDGRIDFGLLAAAVHNHIRGMNPWPGAFTQLRGKVLKVHTSMLLENVATTTAAHPGKPGEIILADRSRVIVACGAGSALELCLLQVEGKRKVTGAEFYNGRGILEGDLLGG